MRQYIIGLLIGYVAGAYLRFKPLYYAQYYMPGELNPMIEHFQSPYDSQEEDKREARNAVYYTNLLIKMNE